MFRKTTTQLMVRSKLKDKKAQTRYFIKCQKLDRAERRARRKYQDDDTTRAYPVEVVGIGGACVIIGICLATLTFIFLDLI